MPGHVFYLDTSAVLKRYRTEKGTDVVDALYQSIKPPAPREGEDLVPDLMDALRRSPGGNRKIVTSHFTCLEVEAVAARTLRGKSLIEREYQTLLGSFARDLRESLSLQAFDGNAMNEAIEVARTSRLRASDAIQLSAALATAERQESKTTHWCWLQVTRSCLQPQRVRRSRRSTLKTETPWKT